MSPAPSTHPRLPWPAPAEHPRRRVEQSHAPRAAMLEPRPCAHGPGTLPARSLHAPRRRIYTTASTVTSTGLRSPSRRDAARLHPTPPPAVPQCPFPAVCGDTSHLSARCVAACAVHVHLALRRLLVLPLPAHRPHRRASRRVRPRPRVATAAHALTQAWRLGPASAAPPLAPAAQVEPSVAPEDVALQPAPADDGAPPSAPLGRASPPRASPPPASPPRRRLGALSHRLGLAPAAAAPAAAPAAAAAAERPVPGRAMGADFVGASSVFGSRSALAAALTLALARALALALAG